MLNKKSFQEEGHSIFQFRDLIFYTAKLSPQPQVLLALGLLK